MGVLLLGWCFCCAYMFWLCRGWEFEGNMVEWVCVGFIHRVVNLELDRYLDFYI